MLLQASYWSCIPFSTKHTHGDTARGDSVVTIPFREKGSSLSHHAHNGRHSLHFHLDEYLYLHNKNRSDFDYSAIVHYSAQTVTDIPSFDAIDPLRPHEIDFRLH